MRAQQQRKKQKKSHSPSLIWTAGLKANYGEETKNKTKLKGWKTKKMMVHKIEAGQKGGGGINEEENATKERKSLGQESRKCELIRFFLKQWCAFRVFGPTE